MNKIEVEGNKKLHLNFNLEFVYNKFIYIN